MKKKVKQKVAPVLIEESSEESLTTEQQAFLWLLNRNLRYAAAYTCEESPVKTVPTEDFVTTCFFTVFDLLLENQQVQKKLTPESYQQQLKIMEEALQRVIAGFSYQEYLLLSESGNETKH